MMCGKRISEPEENLFAQIRIKKLPLPVREYRFFEYRMWRFDFAWPEILLAVEVDGGSFVSGRHNRGKGFESDLEKLNFAILLGWRILRFTPTAINDWTAVDAIKVAINGGINPMKDSKSNFLAGIVDEASETGSK